MYGKKDYIGGLFLLISFSILLNLIFFNQRSLFVSNVSLTLAIIVLVILGVLSILVALDDNHPKRFLYIFWNPIISGILGAYSFYLWIEQSNYFSLKNLIYALIILYSIIVIYFTDQFARKFKIKD